MIDARAEQSIAPGGAIARAINLLERPRWRSTVERLNNIKIGRFALYPMYHQWIERVSPDQLSEANIMDFYELHVRMLGPYFYNWLTPEGVSYRLAKQADDVFVDKVHAFLASIADVAEAKRINKLIYNFEHFHQMQRMAGYPDRMYLELTDACNLKCPMCTQAVFTHKRTYMTLDVLERMGSAIRYMDLISFVGCGETLYHPKFREVIESLPTRTAETRIITNGILLSEETSRFLIEQQLDQLWVSLDTTESKTFEVIRSSKMYDKIIRQVETFTRLKRELKSELPHLALNFVARRCNIEQLPDFVRLAHRLGAEKVNVGYLSVYTRELVEKSLFFHQELSDRYMRAAKAVAEELNVELYLPGLFAETPKDIPATTQRIGKCAELYQFVYVHPDGALGPCCVNDSRLGMLQDAPFDELWNGPLYREFRRVVSTPEEDMHCKHCILEGRKDIHKVEHHVKLLEVGAEHTHVEEIDYVMLAEAVAGAG